MRFKHKRCLNRIFLCYNRNIGGIKMKILRIKFDNIIIFKEGFDIDFTTSDRVMANSNVHKIWGPITIQQAISIIGINAVGKTTSMRLLKLAMEVVLNNKGLNQEDLIPSLLINEYTMNNGIRMVVYFYKEEEVFKLESIIKYKSDDVGKLFFYYDDEVLMKKSKSKASSKKNIFDFAEDENSKKIRRSELKKEQLDVLKDDDSIAILASRGSKTTVNTMLDDVTERTDPVHGIVDKKILNVFDENIGKLEKLQGEESVNIEFKNNDVKIKSPSIALEDIISKGTIKGQRIIKNTIIALRSGGYLIIDELENHLNKELVKMIIGIFNDEKTNKKGACIIFTTHYAEILDSFDRKDNIYVLTRDKNNLTSIQKYSDVVKRNELKKSEVILSNYIKGSAPKALNIKELEEYICKTI